MRIIDLGLSAAHPVDEWQSRDAAVAPVVNTSGRGHVDCMRLGPGGVLGRHPTGIAQLFCVVAGEGEVSGSDGMVVSIRAGQAALWEAGEVHETMTATGLTAIIVQAEAIHE